MKTKVQNKVNTCKLRSLCYFRSELSSNLSHEFPIAPLSSNTKPKKKKEGKVLSTYPYS